MQNATNAGSKQILNTTIFFQNPQSNITTQSRKPIEIFSMFMLRLVAKKRKRKFDLRVLLFISFTLFMFFVGTGFEHYSYEISEFKPNEPSTMNL